MRPALGPLASALATLVVLAACSRSGDRPAFHVARTAPDVAPGTAPLLLNDSVTVYFSADVMPVSVTPDSFVVIDERGDRVPGSLTMGTNWVAFHPTPPFAPDLADGSFRPGGVYRLLIAGSPRPDAVRARDGRRLDQPATFELRVAGLEDRPSGLPAPLRPVAADVPFVMHVPEAALPVPADEPRLQVHFSLPLLPSSVTSEAFEVTLLDGAAVEEIVPRRVRVVTWSLDALPGSSVEIDLGAMPRRLRGGASRPLRAGTLVNVALRSGATSVLDYAGRAPLQASAQWSVVPGGSLAIAEWPAAKDTLAADDELSPTFESRAGGIRPRVRVEAGDGSLGVFRPRVDTVLRAGEPFDRGDGRIVVSNGSEFPFLAIDVPTGVTVRVDAANGPVRLLACGSVRIAGVLVVDGPPRALQHRRLQQPVADLAASVSVALIAAGGIEVTGAITSTAPPQPDATCLLLASAGPLDLRHMTGELPFHTLLAFESGGEAIRGARGQSVPCVATFTYGVAPGAAFVVQGTTSWRQLPFDRDAGVVEIVDASDDLDIAWQAAPADPVRRSEPDTTLGRVGRLQPVRHGEAISAGPGAFVRFSLTARVRSGQEPARVRELRIRER